MNQLCKVCGEVAAGYHFGAFTCEGCKSFFGRTYNNRSSIGECKNNNQCSITKKNRTSCKSCRLRKCFKVGMSKSGSRYGRRSNWFKIHCLIQDQAIGGLSTPTATTTPLSNSTTQLDETSTTQLNTNNSITNTNNINNNSHHSLSHSLSHQQQRDNLPSPLTDDTDAADLRQLQHQSYADCQLPASAAAAAAVQSQLHQLIQSQLQQHQQQQQQQHSHQQFQQQHSHQQQLNQQQHDNATASLASCAAAANQASVVDSANLLAYAASQAAAACNVATVNQANPFDAREQSIALNYLLLQYFLGSQK